MERIRHALRTTKRNCLCAKKPPSATWVGPCFYEKQACFLGVQIRDILSIWAIAVPGWEIITYEYVSHLLLNTYIIFLNKDLIWILQNIGPENRVIEGNKFNRFFAWLS
jgi:hypothetical protein